MMKPMLTALRNVCALRAIAGFFYRDQDQLVSARGAEVMANPVLMQQVEEALATHRAHGRSGPVVVQFTHEHEATDR